MQQCVWAEVLLNVVEGGKGGGQENFRSIVHALCLGSMATPVGGTVVWTHQLGALLCVEHSPSSLCVRHTAWKVVDVGGPSTVGGVG